MSPVDTDEFRALLEDERTRLMRASGLLESEVAEDLDDEVGQHGSDTHLADMASETYDRELEEGLDEGVRDTLRRIDDALKRIDDGTYGLCEIDNKPIPEERLRAIPWTTRCIEHAR